MIILRYEKTWETPLSHYLNDAKHNPELKKPNPELRKHK